MKTIAPPVAFNRNEETPLYEQVREYLREQCLAIGPNAPLAPVREMCESLGVNQSTVTRALRDLESDGLLRIIPRKGTFVAPAPESKVELLAMVGEPETLGIVGQRFLAGMQGAHHGSESIAGTTLSVPPYPDARKFAEILRLRQLTALVVCGHDYQDFPVWLDETNFIYDLSQHFPVVLVGKPHRVLELDCVYTDARPQMLQWMQKCYDRGVRRFGYLRNLSNAVHYNERFEAYRQFHLDNCLQWDEELLPDAPREASTDEKERIKALKILDVKPLPEAIILSSPASAYVLVLEALRRGIEPGKDIELLCFAGANHLLQAIEPYVTQIMLFEEEMGRCAMDRIQERLTGTGPATPYVRRLSAALREPSRALN